MRVKELADLTGTTVRTIRYYHSVGLLAVPELRYGYRDYDLAHVARLIRIRWLAQAGLPLSRIAGMLPTEGGTGPSGGPDRAAVLTDLRATAVALDDQLERLQAQRAQVQRLVAAVERDDHLSPMPPAIVRFYDDLEQRAGDEKVRREIRRERDFLEVVFYRAELPPETEEFFHGLDQATSSESLAAFGQLADRSGPDFRPTDAQVEQIASATVARVTARVGDALPRLAKTIDLDLASRAAELYMRFVSGPERRVARATVEAWLTALKEARSR